MSVCKMKVLHFHVTAVVRWHLHKELCVKRSFMSFPRNEIPLQNYQIPILDSCLISIVLQLIDYYRRTQWATKKPLMSHFRKMTRQVKLLHRPLCFWLLSFGFKPKNCFELILFYSSYCRVSISPCTLVKNNTLRK